MNADDLVLVHRTRPGWDSGYWNGGDFHGYHHTAQPVPLAQARQLAAGQPDAVFATEPATRARGQRQPLTP